MPALEADPIGTGCLVARFTFNCTQGPSTGFKNIGSYYSAYPPYALMPGVSLHLGVGGFVNYEPTRTFGLEFKDMARSNPVPMLMGTTSRISILLSQLYYSAPSISEIEQFILSAPDNIGPYAGTMQVYAPNGTTLTRTITGVYFKQFTPRFDGSKRLVEYDLLFEAPAY